MLVLPPKIVDYGSGSPGVALMGSGEAQPPGIDAILEHNGLLMNDRSGVDRIRVRELDGLQDADIRDSREANPGAHGETSFQPFYGGRTVSVNLRVEAHTRDKLRDMQQAVRTAFVDLQERPLIFRTGDIYKDVQIVCRKSTATGGREQQGDYNFFRDMLLTLRASNPRIESFLTSRVVAYPNRMPNPVFRTNIAGWSASASTGGFVTVLERSTDWTSHGIASAHFIVERNDAGIVNAKLAGTPDDINGFPISPGRTYTFTIDADILQDGSTNGVAAQITWCNAAGANISSTTGTRLTGLGEKTFVVSGIAPANAVIGAVRINAMLGGGVARRVEGYVDRAWMVEGQYPPPLFPGAVIIANDGNFFSEPTIDYHGPMAAPKMVNRANGNMVRLTEPVADDETLRLDVAKDTLVDLDGANRFSLYSDDSRGIYLEPGDNLIELDVESIASDPDARVEISSRHTWM